MATAPVKHARLANGFASNDWAQAIGHLDKHLTAAFLAQVNQAPPTTTKFYRPGAVGGYEAVRVSAAAQPSAAGRKKNQKKKKAPTHSAESDTESEDTEMESTGAGDEEEEEKKKVTNCKAFAWLSESELQGNEVTRPLALPSTLAMATQTPKPQLFDNGKTDTSQSLAFTLAFPGNYAPVRDPETKSIPITAAKYLEPLFSDQWFTHFPLLMAAVKEYAGVDPAVASHPLFEPFTQYVPKDLLSWGRAYRCRLGYKKNSVISVTGPDATLLTVPAAALEKGGRQPTDAEVKAQHWIQRLNKRFVLFGAKGICFKGGLNVSSAALKLTGVQLDYNWTASDGPVLELRWLASLAELSFPFSPMADELTASGPTNAYMQRWARVKSQVKKMQEFLQPAVAKKRKAEDDLESEAEEAGDEDHKMATSSSSTDEAPPEEEETNGKKKKGKKGKQVKKLKVTDEEEETARLNDAYD